MKLTTAQIKSISALAILFVCSTFAIPNLAQPTLQNPNRIKDFGKSLKKYEKKGEKDVKDKNASNDRDAIRIETNLVVNDVLVVDQKGNAIADLRQHDFTITEDGVSQDIGLFSFGENAKIPRSIVLLIDYSTSLLPYIDNSTEAAKILVDKLSPNDKMAIVTDDIELLVDFTSDKLLLRKTLDDLVLKCLSGNKVGKSLPFSALLSVLNELFNEEEVRPIIIFQSDGDEFPFLKPITYFSEMTKKYFSGLCKTDKWYCERDFSFGEVTERIEKSNVTIYSVIPGIRFAGFSAEEQLKRGEISTANRLRVILAKPDEKFIAKFSKEYAPTEAKEKTAWQTSMTETAKLSGGYASHLENPKDGEMVYSNIFQVIENRYVIGYYPKNETKDGKRRIVKIEVKGHPEYIVMGRKSYFAPLEEK